MEDNGGIGLEKPCIVCQKETSGAHICRTCNNYVHVICGTSDQEGYGCDLTCFICEKTHTAQKSRNESLDCLKIQAEKMLTRSKKSLPVIEIGKNVTVSIPDVDQGRIDFRNIMAVVLERVDTNYKLGTKNGVISRLFPRSELTLCKQTFFGIENVPMDKFITLRSESIASSLGHGQGIIKCNCKKNCSSKRCICKSKKLLCNSRCHNSNSCFNK